MAGRAPKLRRARVGRRSQRFAIVAARFNAPITQRLVEGAEAAFRAAGLGGNRVEVHWVPGSFELPQAAALLARAGRYAGIVCLGVVVRGQTPHFEHVAREAAAGIREVAIATGVPAAFGVITALSEAQAWARAGGEMGNRGEEAAEAVLHMADWVQAVWGPRGGARTARRPEAARAASDAAGSSLARSPRARRARHR